MNFTDDDLKIIKAGYDISGQKLRALIVRLEAAENLIDENELSWTDKKGLETWRKAAGK